jgi:hypothetical protein
MKTRTYTTLLLSVLILASCSSPDVYKHPIKVFQATSVEIDGAPIQGRSGEFCYDLGDEWIRAGNTQSKIKITNKVPKIIIRMSDTTRKAWVVRFKLEESYRFFYVTNRSSSLYRPVDRYSIVKVRSYTAPDGSLVIEPEKPLDYGEYAVWMDNGPKGPDRMDGETRQDHKARLIEYWGGALWDFSIAAP